MRTSLPSIELPKWILIGIAAWCVAEICFFAVVVSIFGFGGALLLGLTTSLIGFSVLRRLGHDAALNLRQVLNQRGLALSTGSLVDGSLAGLGALLLILPGFLSDLVGLTLSVPAVRLWTADKIKGASTARPKRPAGHDPVIDLGPAEWRRIDEPEPNFRGRP